MDSVKERQQEIREINVVYPRDFATITRGERWTWGNLVQPPGYTFKFTNVPPIGGDERSPVGHSVVCYLESDLMYFTICSDGYVVGSAKANVATDAWKHCARTGTNGNFGGAGQLAAAPEMDDIVNSVHDEGTVWTCVVTLVNADQMQVTFTNDNPLYAGISWACSNTTARTNWFDTGSGMGVVAWHGAPPREWVEAMAGNGWTNLLSNGNFWRDAIVVPNGVRIFDYVM